MAQNQDTNIPNKDKSRMGGLLRAVLLLDALVFLTASLMNFGLKIPLGFAELSFGLPIWQAGAGEALIGGTFLVAAVTGSVAASWVALWLSVAGILFGLSAPKVQGLARDIHLFLVPLAIIVFGLLLSQRQRRRPHEGALRQVSQTTTAASSRTGKRQPIAVAIGVLMVVATVAFAIASIIHFGVTIAFGPLTIDDPFLGAAFPEAVIAAVLAIGAATVIARWARAWPLAFAATLFGLLLTIYGLTITLRSSRTGDVIYHIGILSTLVVIAAMLLLPAARRSLSS